MEPYTSALISVEHAQQLMVENIVPRKASVSVKLAEALGRVTAEPIISTINVPSFDNSAMDGYAIGPEALQTDSPLPIAGQAFAGKPFRGDWPSGTVIQVMTGAVVPTGTCSVIMQEQTLVSEAGITFTSPPLAGKNIRRSGEDVQCGQQVIAAGERLCVKHLALLASLGVDQVSVQPKLRVALFSTGDELVLPGTPLGSGQIYDTNRFAIHLMLSNLGCEVIDLGIIADDKHQLREAFNRADQQADLVISSGGVSVGEADYTRDILVEAGNITFWKLAMKPGKPFAFGQLKDSLFCGLPGNPVSAVVTFCQLVYPLITRLQGLSALPVATLNATLKNNLNKQPGRTDFQRGRYCYDGDKVVVYAAEKQDSHRLSTFIGANCFIVLERHSGSRCAGEQVVIQPFPAFMDY